MTDTIESRLQSLGITLPEAAAPAANYVPFLISGSQLFISGQLPMKDGAVAYAGQVGSSMRLEDGVEAAKLCGINILAQAKAALGDLERIGQCLKLGGFVNAAAGFADHPKVINGASNLMVDVLGEKGKHTRFAVGTSGLPFDAAVEIDAIFAIG